MRTAMQAVAAANAGHVLRPRRLDAASHRQIRDYSSSMRWLFCLQRQRIPSHLPRSVSLTIALSAQKQPTLRLMSAEHLSSSRTVPSSARQRAKWESYAAVGRRTRTKAS
jgi:hypothetical protein